VPSVRWRKVVRDLGVARTRTVLVVLSIAVGVFAVGTIAGANALLQQGLRDAYLASKPASATLSTSPFGDDLVQAVDEAATNAIVHGYAGQPGWVEVAVAVTAPSLPITSAPPPASTPPSTTTV